MKYEYDIVQIDERENMELAGVVDPLFESLEEAKKFVDENLSEVPFNITIIFN